MFPTVPVIKLFDITGKVVTEKCIHYKINRNIQLIEQMRKIVDTSGGIPRNQ